MVARSGIEVIELEVEPLSFDPGSGSDRLDVARRWWDAARPAVAPQATPGWAAAGESVATTFRTGSTSFWRILDVPGDQLGRVLGAWWRGSGHDDGHLRLGEPQGVGNTWHLGGSLRVTLVSKRFGVDVRLAGYARYWSLLELTPRRAIRPTRVYFRVGHDSLDLFSARLRELT